VVPQADSVDDVRPAGVEPSSLRRLGARHLVSAMETDDEQPAPTAGRAGVPRRQRQVLVRLDAE